MDPGRVASLRILACWSATRKLRELEVAWEDQYMVNMILALHKVVSANAFHEKGGRCQVDSSRQGPIQTP